MRIARAFTGGAIAALVLTVLMVIVRAFGVPIHPELLLGSLFVSEDVGRVWLVGFLSHVLIGGLFGIAYGLVFEFISRRAGPGPGLVVAVAHTILAGLVVGLLPFVHPLVPEPIPAPGVFLWRLGALAVAGFVVLHLIYGMIVGTYYNPVRLEHRRHAVP